jgi:NAD(P)-dependent dehydrogenase (short-subunit alcohol dehydrogenase family)
VRRRNGTVYDAGVMKARTCVVTGATGGIGFETARGIADRGATVVIVGRSLEKCRTAVEEITRRTGNPHVEFLVADLSSQPDIRRLARELEDRYPRIHVLVNNVGGLFLNGQVSPEGIEMTLALNHLGCYLLTRMLLPVLKASAPSRIVNVSSFAHLGARLDGATLRFAGWQGYKRSKLANLLFTYELARRLEGTGVTVNALSPGLVASNFGRNNRGPFALMKPLVDLVAISNERGARTSVHLACSPDVEGVTGQYFARCRPRRSSAASYDRTAATRLWQTSATMTGLAAE